MPSGQRENSSSPEAIRAGRPGGPAGRSHSLFAIAFIINAANVSISNAIFSPTSLMLLGLVCLALHLSGVGAGWKYRR